MLSFANRKALAIGEAMVEMAPVGGGLYRRGFAGDTFNTAWHMARTLGPLGQLGFVTRVGRDVLSDGFVAELADDGLDVSGIDRDARRIMGLYLIELDGVERSFEYWRGESAARHLAEDEAWLTHALEDAGLIHLSGITLAILSEAARTRLFNALAAAREHGARVSFDPNIRARLWSSQEEIRATISRFLGITDIVLPSFDDEAANWGDASPRATVARFAAAGVAEIVVKNGADPVTCHADGITSAHATPAVAGIRDTAGAGDAFNAGYLAARLIGHPPAAAVAHGQRLSGEVIRHFGARIPRESVPAFPVT